MSGTDSCVSWRGMRRPMGWASRRLEQQPGRRRKVWQVWQVWYCVPVACATGMAGTRWTCRTLRRRNLIGESIVAKENHVECRCRVTPAREHGESVPHDVLSKQYHVSVTVTACACAHTALSCVAAAHVDDTIHAFDVTSLYMAPQAMALCCVVFVRLLR